MGDGDPTRGPFPATTCLGFAGFLFPLLKPMHWVGRNVAFVSTGAFYETMLHELAHWSEIRLGWTANYAMNELIAEIAASFISAELGVPQG
ncbi:MAG: zincin-like metallopeptidase domain-containing protein, partial [Thermoguttaceae bacterium]